MPRPVPADIAKKLPNAATVFAERGFDRARMDDVAQATGVPRATLYYYFASKDEILGFLLQALLDDVAAKVADAVTTPGSAADRLAAVLRAQLEVLGSRPETAQLLATHLGRAGGLTDITGAVEAAFHLPVREVLGAGAADGTLRAVDAERAAWAVFGAVVLVGLHEIVHGRHSPQDALPDIEAVVLSGLALR